MSLQKSLVGLLIVIPIIMTNSMKAYANEEVNTEVQKVSCNSNKYGLSDNISDGTILDAFSWSFNTIKDHMAEIADSGYSSVQVLPISACVKNGDGTHTWEWENTYQPTDFTIGNYIVGTKDEFIEMNKEAEKYGIKVIVGIVANHVANDWNQVNPRLRNDPSLFHNKGGVYDYWLSRERVTQTDLLGLHDLNTQNHKVQNIIINYIKECIDCGADGFEFNNVQNIELPDDGYYGGDFWPNVVSAIRQYKPDVFLYGKINQDYENSHLVRYSAYGKYLALTADYYGDEIRREVNSKNLCNLYDYQSEGVPPSNLVTYSEAHDTYADIDGKSRNDGEWQIRKGYEIVAARAQGTPLFFARPTITGFTLDRKLEGPLGVPRNDWNNKEVQEVNKFHNAMIGEGEYIRYLNQKTVAIERGNKGVVIVNLDGGYSESIPTNLADGIYIDQVTGETVKVFNGQMNIKVKSGMTAVIYNKKVDKIDNVAYIELPAGWGEPYAYVYDDSTGEVKNNEPWPGVKMTKVRGRLYSYKVDSDIQSPKVIFTDRKQQYPGAGQAGLDLNGSMVYENGIWKDYEEKVYPEIEGTNVAVFELPAGWGEPYAYVYDDSTGEVKNNESWPGIMMTELRDNLYAYVVPDGYANPKVIFTDKKQQYPGVGQEGLNLKGQMIYDGVTWEKYIPNRNGELGKNKKIYMRLPGGWGEPYAFVYDDSTGVAKNNAAWTGVKMTKVTDGIYKYLVPENFPNARVIFTDGRNMCPAYESFEVKDGMIFENGIWSKYTK